MALPLRVMPTLKKKKKKENKIIKTTAIYGNPI
jgi:hypothetical protein